MFLLIFFVDLTLCRCNQKILVRFVTNVSDLQVPDVPFAIPSSITRTGLSKIVNHLLTEAGSVIDNVRFDFLVAGFLLRRPLDAFLREHVVSTEKIVDIEYFPAVMAGDHNGTDVPAWIGCLDARTFPGVIVSGLYDGSIRLHSASRLIEIASLQAHEAPIRSIACLPGDNMCTFITSSKDCLLKSFAYVPDSVSLEHVATFGGHVNSAECVSFWHRNSHDDSSLIVSGDWSGNVFFWSLPKQPVPIDVDSSNEKKRRKGSKGEKVIAAKEPVEVAPMFSFHAHSQSVSHLLCPSKDSPLLITCSWDHSLKT